MMTLYRLLWWWLTPIALLRLLIKSRRNPDYRKNLRQRFGFGPQLEACVWFHTVSVGETLAAIRLIKQLQAQFPKIPVLVTTMTPTGKEMVQRNLDVHHSYLPWDSQGFVRRFIRCVQPRLLVLMETEVWPELIRQASEGDVPVVLANARMSARSQRGYQRLPRLSQQTFSQLALVCGQSQADSQRLEQLGAQRVITTGTVKYDVALSEPVQALATSWQQHLVGRRVWLAASTHPGEESLMLAAHQQLLIEDPSALLILAPRHPDRSHEVSKLVAKQGLRSQRRSQGMAKAEHSVWLLDTLGELVAAMGVSELVVMGGSFVDVGGHNPLEAGVWPTAVLSGPIDYNFAEIMQTLRQGEAMLPVANGEALTQALLTLWQDPKRRQVLAERLGALVNQNQGSTNYQATLITELLVERGQVGQA